MSIKQQLIPIYITAMDNKKNTMLLIVLVLRGTKTPKVRMKWMDIKTIYNDQLVKVHNSQISIKTQMFYSVMFEDEFRWEAV